MSGVDYTGHEDMVDVANDLQEVFEDGQLVELVTELYFLLDNKDRVEIKRNIG